MNIKKKTIFTFALVACVFAFTSAEEPELDYASKWLGYTHQSPDGVYNKDLYVHHWTDEPGPRRDSQSSRRFTLVHDPSIAPVVKTSEMVAEPLGDGIGQLVGDNLRVRVPWGKHSYENGREASGVPAPLLTIQGRSDNRIGKGTFLAPTLPVWVRMGSCPTSCCCSHPTP